MTASDFALKVQRLPRVLDQVLVLSQIAGLRSGSDWFAPAEVLQVFDILRLPRPGNVNDVVGRLGKAKLLVRKSTGRLWSLTPEGRQRVLEAMEALDLDAVMIAEAGSPGAFFGSGQQPVIPPGFAPPRWTAAISRLLERFPFETNVFCMTRYPRAVVDGHNPDPLSLVVPALRAAMGAHGLNLHLASDRQADDELLGNVGAYMWACQYGIGLVEDRYGDGVNNNVAIELGGMLMTGRRCAILKDRTIPKLPTDLVGQIYKSVDFDILDDVIAAAHLWVAEDLGLGRCASCPAIEGAQEVA